MKQVIVMRTDLGMRKGKMIAQGAHASVAAVLPYLSDPGVNALMKSFDARRRCVDEWLMNSFTKICVRVDSENELLSVFYNALDAGLIAQLITDNGLTEFHGVPTNTCCAIGPDLDENIDPITGHLRLL